MPTTQSILCVEIVKIHLEPPISTSRTDSHTVRSAIKNCFVLAVHTVMSLFWTAVLPPSTRSGTSTTSYVHNALVRLKAARSSKETLVHIARTVSMEPLLPDVVPATSLSKESALMRWVSNGTLSTSSVSIAKSPLLEEHSMSMEENPIAKCTITNKPVVYVLAAARRSLAAV